MFGQDLVATTGSHLEDTFIYDFLARAYPFVHKAVVAYPDYGLQLTPRMAQKGPKVDLTLFSWCMTRRIEQQYRGHWCYNDTLWNIKIRDQLNKSRMVCMLFHGASFHFKSLNIYEASIILARRI
jgi:hypothetical protein